MLVSGASPVTSWDPDKGPRPGTALGHLAVSLLSCDTVEFRDFSPGGQLAAKRQAPDSLSLIPVPLLEG